MPKKITPNPFAVTVDASSKPINAMQITGFINSYGRINANSCDLPIYFEMRDRCREATVIFFENQIIRGDLFLEQLTLFLTHPKCPVQVGFNFSEILLHNVNGNTESTKRKVHNSFTKIPGNHVGLNYKLSGPSIAFIHIMHELTHKKSNIKDLVLNFANNPMSDEVVSELKILLNKEDCPYLSIDFTNTKFSESAYIHLQRIIDESPNKHKLRVNLKGIKPHNIPVSTSVITEANNLKANIKSNQEKLIKVNDARIVHDPLLKGGIATKYLSIPGLPKLQKPVGNNSTLQPIKPISFSLMQDIPTGLKVSNLQPIDFSISNSHYTYYSAKGTLPTSDNAIIGIMAGRGQRASLPTQVGNDTRVILVITENQLTQFFLPQFELLWIRSAEEFKHLGHLKNTTVLIKSSQEICQFDGEGTRIDIAYKRNKHSKPLFDIDNIVEEKVNSARGHSLFTKEQLRQLDGIIKGAANSVPLKPLVLSDSTDLLVIRELKSEIYGFYDSGSINARRAAFIEFSSAILSERVMMLDDNINEFIMNGPLKDIGTIWNYWKEVYKGKQVVTTVITNKPTHKIAKNRNQLGSKCFIVDMSLLRNIFFHIKINELPFALFLPAYAGALFGEDYYFQSMVHQGAIHYNQKQFTKVIGVGIFDHRLLMLTRLLTNRNQAKKSVTSADAWACINECTWLDKQRMDDLVVDFIYSDVLRSQIYKTINNQKQILAENWQSHTNKIETLHHLDVSSYHTSLNPQDQKFLSLPLRTTHANQRLSVKELYEQIKQGFLETDASEGQKKYALYDHQDEVIRSWLDQYSKLNFNESVLSAYSLATGTGKTRIQAIIVYLALYHLQCTGNQQSLIVVTPTKELVKQSARSFLEVFALCNRVSGQNINPQSIIKVMSENGSVSQKIVQLNKEPSKTNLIYIYCEASFKRQVHESPETFNAADIIFVDEYHKFIKPLTSCIYQLNGYDIQVSRSEELKDTANTYLLNLASQLVYFINYEGEKKELPFKATQIFNERQLMVLNEIEGKNLNKKNAVSIKKNQELTLTFHQFVSKAKANDIPLIAAHTPYPVYLIDKPVTKEMIICDTPPMKASSVTTTYFCLNPLSIYQSNPYGIIEPVVSQKAMSEWLVYNDSSSKPLFNTLTQFRANLADKPGLRFSEIDLKFFKDHHPLLNDFIIQQGGYPFFNQVEKQVPCFIISRMPCQLIYCDKEGVATEISKGYEVSELLKKIKITESQTKPHYADNDMKQAIAEEANKLIIKKYPAYPLVKSARQLPVFAFSATPPQNQLFKVMCTFSKQQAVEKKIITPAIIRTMDYKDNSSPDKYLPTLLQMIHPNGMALIKAKGLMQFTNIEKADKVAVYLKNRYPDLPVYVIHSETKKDNQIETFLKQFKEGKEGILLTVSMLSLGWDEPTLQWCVSFKKNIELSTWEQFVGRVVRWWPGKIGLALIRKDAPILNKELVIKNHLEVKPHDDYLNQKTNNLIATDSTFKVVRSDHSSLEVKPHDDYLNQKTNNLIETDSTFKVVRSDRSSIVPLSIFTQAVNKRMNDTTPELEASKKPKLLPTANSGHIELVKH